MDEADSVIRYDEVADHAALHSTGEVAVVAVDGPSGSGKSTFARRLAASRHSTVLHIDDFLSWHDIESWWPRFEVEALQPLMQGRAARFQARAWEQDPLGSSLGPWMEVTPSPLLIIEGVGASRQAIARHLGTAVWVEVDRALRLARGIERDGETMRDHWLSFMQLEAAFFESDETRNRAHYVVNGGPTVEHDQDESFVGVRQRTG